MAQRHGIESARAYAAGDSEATLRGIAEVGTASIDGMRLLDQLIE